MSITKMKEKNLVSIEKKVYCNRPIPQNMKSFINSSSRKLQLIDLFTRKLLIEGMQVEEATSDEDMLIVKKSLAKVEKYNYFAIH